MIVFVFQWLKDKKYAPSREAAEPAGLWGLLYHKWYVDELYARAVVRPFQAICRFSWRVVDQGVVDGVGVNGTAYFTRFWGWVASRFQTGNLGTYVLIIVLGILVVIGTVSL